MLYTLRKTIWEHLQDWISKKIMDPAILDECRAEATRYLDAGAGKTVRFLSAVLLIWSLVLFLAVKYLTRKPGH